jgi:hypothetical protein
MLTYAIYSGIGGAGAAIVAPTALATCDADLDSFLVGCEGMLMYASIRQHVLAYADVC